MDSARAAAAPFAAGVAVAVALRLLVAPLWWGAGDADAADDDGESDSARAQQRRSMAMEDDESFMKDEEHKLMLVVRADMGMAKGKVAAQCGHATLAAFKKATRSHPVWVGRWERSGQPKVVLRTRSEAEMVELLRHVRCVLYLRGGARAPQHLTAPPRPRPTHSPQRRGPPRRRVAGPDDGRHGPCPRRGPRAALSARPHLRAAQVAVAGATP